MLKLCNPQVQVLLKQEAKKGTFDNDNETVEVNFAFTNQQLRLNLTPVPPVKKKTVEATEEELEIERQVEAERGF